MSERRDERPRQRTGLARCLELASRHRWLVGLSGLLSAVAAVCSFVPYVSVYYIIQEILRVYPNTALMSQQTVYFWAWMSLAGIAGNVILYFLALACSHVAAFGTLYELKVAFMGHVSRIPLGYHLTLGSGRLRKVMDEDIESVEGFIAHQLPDVVASFVARSFWPPSSSRWTGATA